MKKNVCIGILSVVLCASLLINGYLILSAVDNRDTGTFEKGKSGYDDVVNSNVRALKVLKAGNLISKRLLKLVIQF